MNNKSTVKVWDLLVRIFHWSLVLFFVVAYVTSEEDSILHIYSGYIVPGLISIRIIWGLFGSQYARFSNFVYPPTHVIRYLKGLANKKPEHYIGHNPAAGWMVVALLVSLLVVTITGLKLYAIEEGLGPLARVDNEISLINIAHANGDKNDNKHERHEDRNEDAEEDEIWEEMHEASTNFTLLLIFLHITGVLVSSRLHNENLIKAMITGNKKT